MQWFTRFLEVLSTLGIHEHKTINPVQTCAVGKLTQTQRNIRNTKIFSNHDIDSD